jgi:hypothetical protein
VARYVYKSGVSCSFAASAAGYHTASALLMWTSPCPGCVTG